MQNDLIKVYVTPAQREYLEFLVNRRINDIENAERSKPRGYRSDPNELIELRNIKHELFQAGS